ncbi:hypothetical protein Shyhy02_59350 [Streptomyces hygroscopicus subsp. hygroscopicus]|nr:hypothetical protein Shyhy02_59350 [Streptomyces hygroscopicus subsp. hygroscopicus]
MREAPRFRSPHGSERGAPLAPERIPPTGSGRASTGPRGPYGDAICRDAYLREGRSKLPEYVAPATRSRIASPKTNPHRPIRLAIPRDGYVGLSVICVSCHMGRKRARASI